MSRRAHHYYDHHLHILQIVRGGDTKLAIAVIKALKIQKQHGIVRWVLGTDGRLNNDNVTQRSRDQECFQNTVYLVIRMVCSLAMPCYTSVS